MRAVRPRVVHLQRCLRWATLSASPSAEDLHTQNSRRVGPMARPQGPPPPPAGSEAAHGVVSICRWECVDVAAHHPVSGERGPRARGCARSLQPQTNHTSPTRPSLLVAPQLHEAHRPRVARIQLPALLHEHVPHDAERGDVLLVRVRGAQHVGDAARHAVVVDVAADVHDQRHARPDRRRPLVRARALRAVRRHRRRRTPCSPPGTRSAVARSLARS